MKFPLVLRSKYNFALHKAALAQYDADRLRVENSNLRLAHAGMLAELAKAQAALLKAQKNDMPHDKKGRFTKKK